MISIVEMPLNSESMIEPWSMSPADDVEDVLFFVADLVDVAGQQREAADESSLPSVISAKKSPCMSLECRIVKRFCPS